VPSTDAGPFAAWVVAMQRGLLSGEGIEVPCGTCTACCESGQLIHLEPDEAVRLGIDVDDPVLRPDVDGRCPMLVEGSCQIYEHRPRICRSYDCRIFPATGIAPEDDKPRIAERVAQWRFQFRTDEDRQRYEAVRLASSALRQVQTGGRPTSATQLAAQAVLAHDELLQNNQPII